MAKPQEEKVSFGQRLKQIGMVFKFTAKEDKWFAPLVAGAVLIPLSLTVVGFLIWGWFAIPLGIMLALLGVLIVLNLRSNTAMMNMLEGQPGAGGHILDQLSTSGYRKDLWRVKQAISATTQYDAVHLVIGPPGVILVGEGNPARVRQLITEQKRRLGKLIGEAPLHDFIIGNEEGQLPIRKLRSTITKMNMRGARLGGKEINALDRALTALTSRPMMPKGQLPKDMRPNKGAFRGMRGR